MPCFSECLTLSRRLTGEFPPVPAGEADPVGSIVGSERGEVGVGSPLAGRATEGTTPGTARLELVPASSSGSVWLPWNVGIRAAAILRTRALPQKTIFP